MDNTELVTVDRASEILCVDECEISREVLDIANALVSELVVNKCWCKCNVPIDVQLAVVKCYEDIQRSNSENGLNVTFRARHTLNRGRLYRGRSATLNSARCCDCECL